MALAACGNLQTEKVKKTHPEASHLVDAKRCLTFKLYCVTCTTDAKIPVISPLTRRSHKDHGRTTDGLGPGTGCRSSSTRLLTALVGARGRKWQGHVQEDP